MDFKYYIRKLDIDNLISYDYFRIGSYIDLLFKHIIYRSFDFPIIVKTYFIYFFLRDFFFKFFECFKLFIFFQNNLIYSYFFIYFR